MSRPQFRCLRYLNLDLHGLIFEMSVQNWQDQPGFSHAHRTPSRRAPHTPPHSRDTGQARTALSFPRNARKQTFFHGCSHPAPRTIARATPPTAPALAATSTALVLSFLCINSPWSPFTYARDLSTLPTCLLPPRPRATRNRVQPQPRTNTPRQPPSLS